MSLSYGNQLKPLKLQKKALKLQLSDSLKTSPDYPTLYPKSASNKLALNMHGNFSHRKVDTSIMSRGKGMTSLDAVNKISDFYNTNQVGKALDSVATYHNRIQVIDFVIRRREEIENMQNKIKLQKAGPTIKKLTRNFRRKIRKDHSASTGTQFIKTLPSLLSMEALDPPEEEKLPVPGHKKFNSVYTEPGNNPVEPTIKKADASFDLLSENNIDAKEIELSAIQISSPNKFESANNSPDGIEKIDLAGINHDYSPARQKKIESAKRKLGNFFRQKTLHFDKGGYGLVFSDDKPDSGFFSKDLSTPKTPKKRTMDLKSKPPSYDLAKAQFVNDLCRYLKKHENEHEYQDVILNLGLPKELAIREIEKKARTKFEELFVNKSPILSPKSVSFRTPRISGYEILNSKAGRIQETEGSPCFDMGTKTSYQNISDKKQATLYNIKNAGNDESNDVDDDSFASYTEIQLAKLYRQTKRIKKGMKLLETKIQQTTDSTAYKNLEVHQSTSIKDLYRNNGEIMKLTKKKLAGKLAGCTLRKKLNQLAL